MRVSKSPEDRKQEILDTSMQLFSEKGYEKTSISDIAQKIGVAQGLCYRYFKSKQQLLNCAIDYYAACQVEKMRSIISWENLSIYDLIKKDFRFTSFETDDNYYYKVFHGEGSKKIHDQLSLKICEKLHPILTKYLEKECEKGHIKVDDAYTEASFIVYGQLGVLLSKDLTPDEKISRLNKFMLNYLKDKKI